MSIEQKPTGSSPALLTQRNLQAELASNRISAGAAAFALPEHAGAAMFDEIAFADRITFRYARMSIRGGLTWEADDDPAVYITYLVTGRIEIQPPHWVIPYRIDENRFFIRRAMPGQTAHARLFPEAVRFLQLRLNPDFLLAMLQDELVDEAAHLMEQIRGSDGKMLCDLPAHAAARICISQIVQCNLTGRQRRLYLEGKALELVALIARQIAAHWGNAPKTLPRPAVRHRVDKAHQLLLADLSRSPPIAELARAVKLSETALKCAFKQLYGNTIQAYLRQARLEQARVLLAGTGKTIAQIAGAMGYECPSRFAMAFRTAYGHSPSALRRGAVSMGNRVSAGRTQ